MGDNGGSSKVPTMDNNGGPSKVPKMGDNGGPSKVPTSVRVAGAWKGLIEVLLDEWTVKGLREDVSRRSGFSLASVNMISSGRILKDYQEGNVSSPTLREAGFKENTKLLITRVGAEVASELNQERARSERLSRLMAAADAIAQRSNDDTLLKFSVDIENQSGAQMIFPSDDDRKALVMGLTLHAKGRDLIKRAQYTDALEVLAMAQEALSLCNAKVLEKVDNPPLLQLDTVWCWFLLRDISRLAVARERLSKVREGLKRSHGVNVERLLVLQGGFCPELAVYLRLELLECVVSFHSGNFEAARQSLVSASSKYQQLQVSDVALAQIAAMGFTTAESRKALRMSGQDVHRAVEFIMEERRKKQEKEEREKKLLRDLKELERFGRTPRGKAVNMKKLAQLLSIGYEKRVAAEALRQAENDIQLALDVLSNPDSLAALQLSLAAVNARPRRTQAVDSATLAQMLSIGLEGASQALPRSSRAAREAVGKLLQGLSSQTETNLTETAPAAVQDANSISNGAPVILETHDDGEHRHENSEKEETQDELENSLDDLANNLSGDHLQEYDLEVDKEGEAIKEYTGLLDGV